MSVAVSKKNKKAKQKQTPSADGILPVSAKSLKGTSEDSPAKKSAVRVENGELRQENASLSALTVELQRSLRASKLQLTDMNEESAATIELLRMHLSQLQELLDATTHKYQDQVQALSVEKEMLTQQNEQLQEQLEHYYVEHKRAIDSIDSLSALVWQAPRFQLLHAVKCADKQ